MSENNEPITPVETDDSATEELFTQADLDRARAQASQTARKNAKKELLNDPDFESAFRQRFEEEANMTAEQKFQALEAKLNETQRDLAKKENALAAKLRLIESGIVGDQLDSVLPLVTSEDPKATEANVDSFLNLFNMTVETKVKEETQKILGSADLPQGGGAANDAQTIQAQIDALSEDSSLDARAKMVALMFQAQEQGIAL